jgi:hypothetical protein
MSTNNRVASELAEQLLPTPSIQENVSYVRLSPSSAEDGDDEGSSSDVQASLVVSADDSERQQGERGEDGNHRDVRNKAGAGGGGGAKRINSMDLLRGFIMIIMSWDVSRASGIY